MTQAQKTAKAKFKQAIAYRQKTGVSLKEAFSHIYGKKTATKKVAKKAVRKKAAKKRIGKVDTKLKKQLASKGKKMPHGYDVVKRKRKIGAVSKKATTMHKDTKSHNVNIRVMSGIEDRMFKDLYSLREKIANTKQAILKLQSINKYEIPQKDRFLYSKKLKDYKKYLVELNTHYRELKKHI